MSRGISTGGDNPNPCKYFIEWKKGSFQYYDKDKQENVDLGHEITFLVLDSLVMIKGFDNSSESGIYSNAVRDTRIEELEVKSFKGGDIASGIYSVIKDKVKVAGGKFCKSTYVIIKIDGNFVLANIAMYGALLGEWSNFVDEVGVDKVNKMAIAVTGKKKDKKGGNTFEVPVFEIKKVSEETDKLANDINSSVLQPYLKDYFSNTTQPTAQVATNTTIISAKSAVNVVPAVDEDDDLPF